MMGAAGPIDFSPVHEVLERHVARGLLPGASCAVLKGREVVDLFVTGQADIEAGVAMREDHLFRMFSNTKIVASCAALLLFEEGRFDLDEPVGRFIPQLTTLSVLKAGATRLDEVEPARGPITIRHLLTHTSGLSYGLFDAGSVLFQAYNDAKILTPNQTLEQMMDKLSALPLAFHPGDGWTYSVATDVIGHLVEKVSGQAFDAFCEDRIFGPLGMSDTGFYVPEDKASRLTTNYLPADVNDPLKPGLTPIVKGEAGWLRQPMRPSGGGGMLSTLPDTIRFFQALQPGGPTLLKPETLPLLFQDQLPPALFLDLGLIGRLPLKGHSLAGAVTRQATADEHPDATGELQWGGLAGTHWWINPARGLTGLIMTQRQMGFWNPYAAQFKQAVLSLPL
jgi:CubicO group peptidase (beta-lactamase class C family)